MNNTSKLTLRQQKFVDAYLECGNATAAAVEAGFQPAYAQGVLRYPSVKAYLAERRAVMIPSTEVVDFLKAVMRGDLTADKLRTNAAIQLGRRAGLWKNEITAKHYIEEAMKNG